MVFSSLVFLCLFLPSTLVLYFAVPRRYRNTVALLASALFYAWGAPRFVLVLLATSTLDYLASRGMVRAGGGRRRAWLAAAISLDLGVFLYFKYANFFVAEFNRLLSLAGIDGMPWSAVILPIGISFFTFQKLSYLIDVYRGTVPPARSLRDYLLYVSLFPQLIAGPIVRYHDVAVQLRDRRVTAEMFVFGAGRFVVGLARKVLIANTLGEVADTAFAGPQALTPGAAAVGLLCYSFQIYFDFAGYSDMAIGLGRMLGFTFLENFRAPYIARNFADFWRRWHISLSNWMREYLYIPLGGNRRGTARTYANLWLVFLFSGLWHGASWNFLVWGLYHGFFISVARFVGQRRVRLPRAAGIALTFGLVTLGWTFFRAETLPQAWLYLRAVTGTAPAGEVTAQLLLNTRTAITLSAAAILSFAPAFLPHDNRLRARLRVPRTVPALAWRCAGVLLLLVLSAAYLVRGGFNPFIYFQF